MLHNPGRNITVQCINLTLQVSNKISYIVELVVTSNIAAQDLKMLSFVPFKEETGEIVEKTPASSPRDAVSKYRSASTNPRSPLYDRSQVRYYATLSLQ